MKDNKKSNNKNKVIIFDTTLRDGEQAAGIRLDAIEKLEVAKQLVKLNVDIIEAGYPNSSREDFYAVELLSKEIDGPIITALSRAVPDDIEACIKALKGAGRPRIHTGLGVSPYHIMGKFKDNKYGKTYNKKKEYLLHLAIYAVKIAKRAVSDVQFYAEDAGRADRDFLFLILEEVIAAGATVINIPDTTGYASPEQFGNIIREIKENVAGIDKVVISVHCHNDLGLAVANSLAGIMNGARQVECTINGIGERAGNASLEEIVMNLITRRDYYKTETNINIHELYNTSLLVSKTLGIPIPSNKAIVGSMVYSHSSGIHVDGFLKSKETYEIVKPEDVGFPSSEIILTARSGRAALKHRLEELGYNLSKDELDKVYNRFIDIGDKVRVVTDDLIIALIKDDVMKYSRNNISKVQSVTVT